MAHKCPECGMLCHCRGDIDDIILDTYETYLHCEHYMSPDCAGYEGDFDDDEYLEDDPAPVVEEPKREAGKS